MWTLLDETTLTILKSVNTKIHNFINDSCDMFKVHRPIKITMSTVMTGSSHLIEYTQKYVKSSIFSQSLIKYGSVQEIDKYWELICSDKKALQRAIENNLDVVKYVQNKSRCFVHRSAYHDPSPTHYGIRAGKLDCLLYLYKIRCLYIDRYALNLAVEQKDPKLLAFVKHVYDEDKSTDDEKDCPYELPNFELDCGEWW